MSDDEEEYSFLQAICELATADRIFHQRARFLEERTRNHIVAAHLRNTSQALSLLQLYLTQEQNIVLNIPIDLSGNFMDPVRVVPTSEQIAAATETHVGVTDTQCAICQENLTCATRIRHCGHTFHGVCIQQWFEMNPRCPVCRHDIRDLNPNSTIPFNDRSMHPNAQ